MENIQYQAEIELLRERLAEYAQENAELRLERDLAMVRVESNVPTAIATPEEEAELELEMATAIPDGFRKVIEEMDAKYG